MWPLLKTNLWTETGGLGDRGLQQGVVVAVSGLLLGPHGNRADRKGSLGTRPSRRTPTCRHC